MEEISWSQLAFHFYVLDSFSDIDKHIQPYSVTELIVQTAQQNNFQLLQKVFKEAWKKNSLCPLDPSCFYFSVLLYMSSMAKLWLCT